MPPSPPPDSLAEQLCQVGRELAARGLTPATSGNFSAVLARDPLRLVITPSGADKGRLTAEQMLEIDGAGCRLVGEGRPSDETRLHLLLVRERRAGAVLHTHSLWSALVSERHAAQRGVAFQGLELLKALEGVKSHAHREWLPIVENAQDWEAAAPSVAETLENHPGAHGFLLRGHGLYTWGRDLAQARRHLEALEFLLELVGRSPALAQTETAS